MEQEKLIATANKLMERVRKDKEIFKQLIEKGKENFTKKEENMKKEEVKVYASRNEVNEKLQNKKYISKINWDNNYLKEIPWEDVLVETDKAVLIDTTLSGHIWVNKKYCYKSKRYQFKPVFLIKVFNEMTYNIETYGDPDEPATIKGAHIKW